MRTRFVLASLLLPLSRLALSAPAETLQYEDAISIFESLGDFEREDGTLAVQSEEPLRVQLVERVFPGELPEVIRESMQRCIIYGVYRAFVHLDVDTITVSAVPGLVDPPRMSIRRLLGSYRVTISLSRAHALAHAQMFCEAESFRALVGDRVYGGHTFPNQLVECFERLQYIDQGGPGLAKFFPGLAQ